ncbi:MAG TPA: cupredoxin domain-containing protein [Candidatus Limnocylindrales bacterium]|nr:cupredoxin domain-containing protein [Candidatus Limnocylindrales bacterium]
MQLLENIWNGILDLTKLLVIPDWGALIALLPVFMGVLVIVFFLGRVLQYRRLGPRRRRPGRVKPVTPPGLHMPGPTYAPIFAAIGTFLLFMGLVFNGLILVLGLVALLLTLLYWGREGLTDYDHVAGDHPQLPAVVHDGPPPGVHMPGPSFRPILASLGVAVLFAGLVFGGWVLAVGVIFTIAALLGWLSDARKEYRQVERADTTGHLENEPAPGWPRALLSVFAVLVIAAIALNAGWLPPRSASGESGGPSGSAAPSGGPAGSGAPGAGGLAISASGVKFDVATLTAPADKPFTIHFDNKDIAGTPHDVDIFDASGAKVVDNKVISAPSVQDYPIPPLKAGTYKFACSIHPTMTGQLTVGG